MDSVLCDKLDYAKAVGIGLVGAVLVSRFIRWFLSSTLKVDPKGKAVLITGCDSGFGLALAKQLSSLNFHVFALCLNSESDSIKQLTSLGCDVIQCNVIKDDDVKQARLLIDLTLKEKGLKLWGVVNNAGILEMNFVEWQTLESYQKILNVNTFGYIRILQAFLPYVRACAGRVVNMASIAAYLSPGMMSAYSMSKYAVRALSDSLRVEVKRFGVHVAVIQPNAYRTGILNTELMDAQTRDYWRQLPQDVRDDYTTHYMDLTINKRRQALANDGRKQIHEVVDAITHALTSQYPHAAYDCNWTSTMLRYFMTYLPYSVTDKLIGKLYVP